MRVIFESSQYPSIQIRPESPLEDYALQKWYEDWVAGKANLQVSYKSGDGYATKVVEPKA